MNLDLKQSEIEILRTILEKELDDLRSEVHHTEDREYKEGLKAREETLRGLLARLAG